jgi:NitT/TauT family transport system ATP-binding protein
MRQRAGIARAFLIDPDVLLMDEPFGSLDAQTRLILQEELLKIWSASRKSVLYITHDIEEAILLGDRVLVMTGRPGSIRADIPIPIDRPRQFAQSIDEAVIDIKWQIWKMLEAEVRTSLTPAA